MTSVVDKYYRRIIQNIDNIRMKFDISALLVKSKEHDSKIETNESNISDNLGKIETNVSNISDNLGKIETNVSNISDNLGKIETNVSNISDNLNLINTNKNNISDNLGKIETNESNISDNLNLINTNKNNISDNLGKIETNESNISDNLNLINTNKNNISDNLGKIETNESNISDNLGKIETNESNISNNKTKIGTNDTDISKIFELLKNEISQITFKKSFGIENKDFRFNRVTHFFEIFSTDIENNFLKNGELRISTNIYYKYKNLSNDITRLCHEFQLYSKDGLINTQVFNHQFYGEANYTTNILYVKENFHIKLFNNYSKLKLILMLHRVNRKGTGNIDLETYNNNSINISFIENPIT